jgi:hypothetical protein
VAYNRRNPRFEPQGEPYQYDQGEDRIWKGQFEKGQRVIVMVKGQTKPIKLRIWKADDYTVMAKRQHNNKIYFYAPVSARSPWIHDYMRYEPWEQVGEPYALPVDRRKTLTQEQRDKLDEVVLQSIRESMEWALRSYAEERVRYEKRGWGEEPTHYHYEDSLFPSASSVAHDVVDNKGYDYQGDTKKAKNAVYASLKRLEKRGLIQRERDADSLAYFIPELDPYRSGE